MAFARSVAAALAGGEMPLLGDGRQRRDFTYVAEAFRLLGAAVGAVPQLDPRPADAREPRSTAADLGRIRDELGGEPGTTLELGLRRQVEHAAAAAAA